MSKSKKKRTKKYQGADAADAKPHVIRVTVPKRSPIGKWWYEHKKRIIGILRLIAVTLILYALISWLVGLVF